MLSTGSVYIHLAEHYIQAVVSKDAVYSNRFVNECLTIHRLELMPMGHCCHRLNGNHIHILVPVVGGCQYQLNERNPDYLVAGQVLAMGLEKHSLIQICNPFSNSEVQFLHLELLCAQENAFTKPFQCVQNLVLNGEGVAAHPSLPFNFRARKYSGREEHAMKLQPQNSSMFVYAASGAFECEGRLLHAGDSLQFEGFNQVEMESLSEGAVAFTLEW